DSLAAGKEVHRKRAGKSFEPTCRSSNKKARWFETIALQSCSGVVQDHPGKLASASCSRSLLISIMTAPFLAAALELGAARASAARSLDRVWNGRIVGRVFQDDVSRQRRWQQVEAGVLDDCLNIRIAKTGVRAVEVPGEKVIDVADPVSVRI